MIDKYLEKSIWEEISELNKSNLLSFLNKHVSDKITEDDVKNDISLRISSAYGGTGLGVVKISEVIETLQNIEDKELNRDYFLDL